MRLWPVAALAPSRVPGNEPVFAIDGLPSTSWNAGNGAPSYITVDLGRTTAINKIRLQVNQYPDGDTRHDIYVARQSPSVGLKHVATLSGWTVNGQWLELSQPIGSVRYVRIETLESPSWVSWRDIEIYQGLDYFGYYCDACAWVDGGTFTAETHSAGANFTFIAPGSADPHDQRRYILRRLIAARDLGCKAFVDLGSTLFQYNGNLWADWRARWNALSDAVSASALANTVIAFYPHDEVYLYIEDRYREGVPGTPDAADLRRSLNMIATAIRERYPDKAIATIMSTAELKPRADVDRHDSRFGLGLDPSHFEMFDWLGFDLYPGPEHRDPQAAWDSSRMPEFIGLLGAWLGPNQRLMAVPEAWWQAANATTLDQDALVGRIDLWHKEILSDGRYVAVVPFLWQDMGGNTGTRSMPRVKERLRQLAAYYLNANDPLSCNAHFIGQDMPTSLVAGTTQDVVISMSNTSLRQTWTPGQHRLGTQRPQDNLSWGRRRVDLPHPVPPGQSVRFKFQVVAPAAPGTVPFQWRMLDENVTWFGDYTETIPVVVVEEHGERQVPDVIDMTVPMAKAELERVNLVPKFLGQGRGPIVVKQMPPARSMVSKNSQVTCTCGGL